MERKTLGRMIDESTPSIVRSLPSSINTRILRSVHHLFPTTQPSRLQPFKLPNLLYHLLPISHHQPPTTISMASYNNMARTVLLFAVFAAAMCFVDATVQPKKHVKPVQAVQVPSIQETAPIMESGIRTKQPNLNNKKQSVRQFDVFENTVGSCRDFLSDCVTQRGCDQENGCYILRSTVARTCCKCFLECAAAGDIYTAGKCSGWAKDRGVESCFTF